MNPNKLIGEGYSEMGEFWLPDFPEIKIVGMLSVEARDRVILKIFHEFPGCDTLRMSFDKRGTEFDVIHGDMRSNTAVVLFKCIHLGSAIQANYLLRGVDLLRHSSLAEYKFETASALYNDTSEWLGNVFTPNHSGCDTGDMHLRKREVPMYKINGCEIKLNYRWDFKYSESELTSNDIFSFKFDKAKDITEIMEYTSVLGDFLLLCTNTPITTKFECVGTGECESRDGVQLIYQKRNIRKRKKPKFTEIVSYWTLANEFQSVLDGWFELGLDKEIRDAIALYTESHVSDTVTEITFLILFQACEGIVKRVEPNIYIGKKKCTRWIFEKLLCSTATPLIDFLNNEAIEKLVKRMNQTRKYWIHNSGKVAKIETYDGLDLVAINRLLSYTIRAYLLQKIGVSQELVKQCLSPYHGIGSYLLEELKTMCLDKEASENNAP